MHSIVRFKASFYKEDQNDDEEEVDVSKVGDENEDEGDDEDEDDNDENSEQNTGADDDADDDDEYDEEEDAPQGVCLYSELGYRFLYMLTCFAAKKQRS